MPSLSRKGIGGILVIIALIAGAFLLFGGRNNGEQIPVTGSNGSLGRAYAAVDVDSNGCPTETSSQFYPDETVFIGLTQSRIPSGTEIFARLYRMGRPIEDTRPIQADRDLTSCVWFAFEPVNGAFDPGEYVAEIIVNGNPVETVSFTVGGEAAGIPQTGGQPELRMGALYTSTDVDSAGCPVDDTGQFFSNESVYVAFQESYIEGGTEMFARLYFEGQPVEDTDPIYADRPMQTCVWFVFEPTGSGFDRGQYEVEIYANGSLVDATGFVVQ